NEPTTATNNTKRILSTPDEGKPCKAEKETPSNTITGNSGQFAFVPQALRERAIVIPRQTSKPISGSSCSLNAIVTLDWIGQKLVTGNQAVHATRSLTSAKACAPSVRLELLATEVACGQLLF